MFFSEQSKETDPSTTTTFTSPTYDGWRTCLPQPPDKETKQMTVNARKAPRISSFARFSTKGSLVSANTVTTVRIRCTFSQSKEIPSKQLSSITCHTHTVKYSRGWGENHTHTHIHVTMTNLVARIILGDEAKIFYASTARKRMVNTPALVHWSVHIYGVSPYINANV